MLLSEAGVNTRTVNALAKKKIHTTDDVLRCLPRKYLDYREIQPLIDAKGKNCAIEGYLQDAVRDEKKHLITLEILENSSGEIVSVTYFHQDRQWERLKKLKNREIVVCGKVDNKERFGWTINSPYSLTNKEFFKYGIIPVYPKMKGVSDTMLLSLIKMFLKDVDEPLETEILDKAKLMGYKEALTNLHFPKSPESIKEARKRLAFNDLMYFSMQMQKSETEADDTTSVKIQQIKKSMQMYDTLPYMMTEDQALTLNKIRTWFMSGKRLDCLIQGDVGCGKTLIAFFSMFMMAENGYQSCIMAPTETLARQHYQEFIKSYPNIAGKTCLLCAGLNMKEKKEILTGIVTGETLFVIGTHSVISKNVMFHNLGLVITDEEHRFGVEQREMLIKKATEGAHIISMSATPIPRTLASVLYGENKEIFEIHSLPEGRIPTQTAVNNNQNVINSFLEKQLKQGRQAYVICPVVNETEDEDHNKDSVELTGETYRLYFETIGYKTGIVHGKMNPEEKDEVLSKFRENKIQILVATTVVEVGVNVPNASTIVIHNAEQFGLATLHQLRGRVGRGSHKGYCILKSRDKANERLKAMTDTTDGFKIAEYDLSLRGAGDLIGASQSGKNSYLDLIMAQPAFYAGVKKYAKAAINNRMGSDLISLYEKNQEAKEKKH